MSKQKEQLQYQDRDTEVDELTAKRHFDDYKTDSLNIGVWDVNKSQLLLKQLFPVRWRSVLEVSVRGNEHNEKNAAACAMCNCFTFECCGVSVRRSLSQPAVPSGKSSVQDGLA